MRDLFECRLIFITGKGGVGKTSVTTAIALLGARRGRRVLACELEATGALPSLLGLGGRAYGPRRALENLSVSSMDTEAALHEYLQINLHVPFLDRIGPLAEALDFVGQAAPGVRELVAIGKLCYEVREDHYDLVVVDATATGHVVGHLAAPVEIHELAAAGAVRSQTEWMIDILSDPAKCGVIVVTTPEETPVNETTELARRLRSDTSVPLLCVIANRVPHPLFSGGEAERFERLVLDAGLHKDLADGGELGPVLNLLDAARFSVQLRERASVQLRRLYAGVDNAEQILYLPELDTAPSDLESLEALCAALAEELSA